MSDRTLRLEDLTTLDDLVNPESARDLVECNLLELRRVLATSPDVIMTAALRRAVLDLLQQTIDLVDDLEDAEASGDDPDAGDIETAGWIFAAADVEDDDA